MKLHILGCGDAFGSGGRNQSAYLVEADERYFLLNCGPTTLLAMKRACMDPRRLGTVFISHLHGDHFGGLPFLFIEFLHQRPRVKPLHIAGPPHTEDKVRQLFRLMYGGSAAGNHVRFVELANALPRLERRKLVLTHLGEEMLARKKELAVTVAEDGMVIEI